MSVFDEISKSWFSSALVGIGAALVAPVVFPALGNGVRPLAKSVIRGGIVVYDKAKELIAEAGEEMTDLVAEVRSEMQAETESSAPQAAGTAQAQPEPGHIVLPGTPEAAPRNV